MSTLARASITRDVVEFLYGKQGKLITISELTNHVFGHGGSTLQKKVIESIPTYRKYSESRGYGFLISVHENVGNRSRVTHVLLADEKTNPKYITRELSMRQARALGFIRSRDRGVSVVKEQKLLPEEDIKKSLHRGEYVPIMLSQGDREKVVAEAKERNEQRKKPVVGKPVQIEGGRRRSA